VNIGNLKTPLLKLYPLSNKLSRVHPKLTYLFDDAVLGLGTCISIIKLDEGCGYIFLIVTNSLNMILFFSLGSSGSGSAS
jgi:hypothetical protein